MTYVLFFFQISKKFEFYEGFPKISVFRDFGRLKLKILKFRDCHFVECVMLHLYCSFCAVYYKTLFLVLANFLTLSLCILVKNGVK